MSLRTELLEVLADGQCHSGEEIAQRFSLSRTAIWKHLATLREMGIEIEAKRGNGYQVVSGLDLLSSQAILQEIAESRQPASLTLLSETTSTNQVLIERADEGDIHKHVVVAEYQRSGRGRRGRQWQCPYAAGLLLSIGWKFRAGAQSLAGLSLAVGVVIQRALVASGCSGAGLKWPNDIYFGDKKLGGVLIEIRGEVASELAVVIGIGINVHAQPPESAKLRVPATCLRTVCPDMPGRNVIAASLIEHLMDGLEEFSIHGFGVFQEQWLKHDIALERVVVIGDGDSAKAGTVSGVDTDGALLLRSADGVERILAGDVSLQL